MESTTVHTTHLNIVIKKNLQPLHDLFEQIVVSFLHFKEEKIEVWGG